jgi:hypothetical protein
LMDFPTPLVLDRVFDDPARLEPLIVRHAPYWNQVQYQPAPVRTASAATPAGHPFAMEGGAPPLFRGNWADVGTNVEGVEELVAAPVLRAAALELFGGATSDTTFLYVNITAPMPQVDAGHVDVPAFRGLDRHNAPGWLLLAMNRSGSFDRWRVRTATAVVWFYEGTGGTLRYWPAGITGPSREIAPVPNTAIVGDNDRMFHRVEAIGDPDLWRPVSRSSQLHNTGPGLWEIRDADEVLSSYRFDQLRVSLSWKAAVWLDDKDRQRWLGHSDDLSLARATDTLADHLRTRGLWADDHGAVDDPEFVEAIMAGYPRTVPTDDSLPKDSSRS